ncbi:MAG: hypothetical protein ACTHMV_19300 [Chitinophagaceae bacterium]
MSILVTKQPTMSGLSERQQNICIYGGIFGVMLAATCLIQHIRFSTSHWIAFVLMGVYVYSLFVFVLLSLQKGIAPLLMITSSSFVMIALVYIIAIEGFYSLALILLFLYCTVITIVIYMEHLPTRLKEKAQLKKQEEMAWKDKL